MSFLTPTAIAIAAALTVPPLVALYFLKLRRQEMLISSTFFWKRAVQDLQVNAPFQKIRRNLLMFLQLIVLLLAAFALGQPLLQSEEKGENSLIIMIDRSASMNVVEPDGRTRLAQAKEAAVNQVEQMGDHDRAMVISFSDSARIEQTFSDDRDDLKRAIDSIKPTQGESRLREAVELAKAHTAMQVVGMGGPSEMVVPGSAARVALFSDGQIKDAAAVSLERMAMDLYPVGISDDNVGITTLQASRYFERPEILNVVATIQNFGPASVTLDAELFTDGEHRDIQTLELGPGIQPADGEDFDPFGSVEVVAFDDILFESSGVIEVRLSRADSLAADNRAYAVVEPSRSLSLLLVTPGSPVLEWVMPAIQESLPVEWSQMTPRQYEQASDADLSEGGRSLFDVVIFVGCSTERLPAGSYIFFGEVPRIDGFALGEKVEFDEVYDWDDSHPIMRHVDPTNVIIEGYSKFVLPDNAVSLMTAEEAGVLFVVNHQASRFLLCAFRPEDSTWYLRIHFPIFMMNAIQYFSGGLDTGVDQQTRPGDPLVIDVAKGETRVTIVRPDGSEDTANVGSLATARYARTDLVGLYRARAGGEHLATFAVNLFSATEGLIRRNADFVVGGDAVDVKETLHTRNVAVWSWLLGALLAFLLLEWAVYSKRILV